MVEVLSLVLVVETRLEVGRMMEKVVDEDVDIGRGLLVIDGNMPILEMYASKCAASPKDASRSSLCKRSCREENRPAQNPVV